MSTRHPFTQFVLRLTFNSEDWDLFDKDCKHAVERADPKLVSKKLKQFILGKWMSYSTVTQEQWDSLLEKFHGDQKLWKAICDKRGHHPRLTADLKSAILALTPDQWFAIASREPRKLNEAIQQEYWQPGRSKYPQPRTGKSKKVASGQDLASSMPIIIEDWPGKT